MHTIRISGPGGRRMNLFGGGFTMAQNGNGEPAPSPSPSPSPTPTPTPAPQPDINQFFLFPTTVAPLACPLGNGTYLLRDPATLAVLSSPVVALPPGAVVLPPGDPRCAGTYPAPAPAEAPAAGISTETALIGAGVAAGLIAVVALLS